MKKWLIRIIAVVLFLALVYGVGVWQKYPNKKTPVGIALEEERSDDDKLSSAEAKADFEQLCDSLKRIHPAFAIKDTKEFEAKKEEMAESFHAEMTVGEFRSRAEELLRALNDCNTALGRKEVTVADYELLVTQQENPTVTVVVNTTIDEALAAAVAREIENGAKRVVIDVTFASGEDLAPYYALLDAIGAKSGRYGKYIYYSKEATAQVGYVKKRGAVLIEPSNDARAPEVVLEVYAGEHTKNAANCFAVLVADGKLGKVFGTPKQAPSHYAEPIYVQLAHSKIVVHVSHLRMMRPDRALEGALSLS